MFDEEGDVNTLAEKFVKRLNKTIAKCFKKVRIKDKTNVNREDDFLKWRELKKYNNKSDKNSQLEIEELENRLAEEYAKEYYDKIKENVGSIDCEYGGINSGRLWDLKKNIFPKSREPPTTMKHPKTGNILTTDDKIMRLLWMCFQKDWKVLQLKKSWNISKMQKKFFVKN